MKLLGMIFITALFACSKKSPTYIQGYVYSDEKKPIQDIKIEDPDNKNLFSITDNNGYFRIEKMINGRYLYVIVKGKKVDSVYIVRTHPERGVNYKFVEGKKDTLFIDMKKQKIISQ